MNEKNYRGFFMKMSDTDDENLDFLMKTEGITVQADGIRRALRHYKKTHMQIALLEKLLEEQKKTNEVLTSFLLKGN